MISRRQGKQTHQYILFPGVIKLGGRSEDGVGDGSLTLSVNRERGVQNDDKLGVPQDKLGRRLAWRRQSCATAVR